MARPRTTVGKLERDQAKREKARAKQESRLARRADQASTAEPPPAPAEDQAALLAQFARLHEDLADGRISMEEFESRQEELRERLRID